METIEPKTKKKIYKRWWFWVLAIIVIIIIIASTGNNPKKIGQNTGNNEAPATAENQTFKVGDQVKLGSSIVTVNKVEFSQGGQYTKPAAGNEWVNLNITIENTGSSQQYITTLGQMFVRDGDKNSYQISVTDKILENPSFGLDGQIIAKSKRTGWVGFEILKAAQNLQFQYNGSMFGGGTVLIDLGR